MATLPTLQQYKEQKIDMLRNDFWIVLTEEQVEHIYSLPSEMRVDAYARDILNKRFG
jgi:hypothetical protein